MFFIWKLFFNKCENKIVSVLNEVNNFVEGINVLGK